MCSTWQESVPAIGLTFSDQRQPGSKVPPADRVAAQIDHFDAAFVVGELAYLIGTLESLCVSGVILILLVSLGQCGRRKLELPTPA
jgi:hypothetical protein